MKGIAALTLFARNDMLPRCHCEERSDAAISYCKKYRALPERQVSCAAEM